MNCRAQAGLEYLLTYGWALVLIATVVGVLMFVVVPPTSVVSFSSSSSRFAVKSSRVDVGVASDNVELVLQNVAGMDIMVTGLTFGGSFAGSTGVTLNEQQIGTGVVVPAGAEMRFAGVDGPQTGSVSGSIGISYVEVPTNLQMSFSVSATGNLGGGGAPPGPPAEDCVNGIDDDADGAIDCHDTDCYSDSACIVEVGLTIAEAYDWSDYFGFDDISTTDRFNFAFGCEGGECVSYRIVFTDGPDEGEVYTITWVGPSCWDWYSCASVSGLDVTDCETNPDPPCPEYVGPPWTFNIIKP